MHLFLSEMPRRIQSLRSDSDLSDDESEITWYDAENTDKPCEPQFCEQNGHSCGVKSEHNTSDSDSESTHQQIACFLHDWASKHNIPRVALNELLAYLQLFHKSLPNNSRTLAKTTTDTDVHRIQGALYHHFHLQSASIKILNSRKATANLDWKRRESAVEHCLKVQEHAFGLYYVEL